MGMSIPYESHGRTNQKLRTRSALVDAARTLISRGVNPTVEDAAMHAAISRTTAYRYFPNQRDLLIAAYPVIDRDSLLPPNASDDVEKRLDVVIDEFVRMTLDNEAALRTALRLSLEAGPTEGAPILRRGRAIEWFKEALRPLQGKLPKRELDRLVYAIRSAVGIEALIWLCDVAGLEHKQAVDVMKWSARSLLRSALAE